MSEVISLPRLDPFLKLYPALTHHDGNPQWTLYHPVSNQYFKIGWAEFECISRFHKHDNSDQLIQAVNNETSLSIDDSDIKSVIMFLDQNGLLSGNLSAPLEEKKKTLFEKIMHGYLYFTIPLLRPDKFLDKTIDIMRPLFSKTFHVVMMCVLVFGVLMTLPKSDEFLNGFPQMISLDGIILSFIILGFIKLVHEFSHAYAAKIYDVHVPHMGIAFIVLYPIFYTEATGAWRLKNKKHRINIGLAGIRFEIYLAAIALIAWNFLPPGIYQMTAFSVVMISLIGSLLINLNPLMRFDGYYVLSDYLQIENLHGKAIDYARQWIRYVLFGWIYPIDHDYPKRTSFFLRWFGLSILIYRFFLFVGISVLVYAVFMKPIGFLAMMFELIWFIGLPVFKEVKLWWGSRSEFKNNKRTYFFLLCVLSVLFLFIIPRSSTITLPAVMHAKQYHVVYAPISSMIKTIHVQENEKVKKGDILVSLSSPLLDQEIKKAQASLQNLIFLKRREQTDISIFRGREKSIDQEIISAKKILSGLKEKNMDLTIMSNFDGVINDVNTKIKVGQYITVKDIILRVVNSSNKSVTGFVELADSPHIDIGSNGCFRANYRLLECSSITVAGIDKINIETLDYLSLSDLHGGPISTKKTKSGIVPLIPYYEVKFTVEDNDSLLTTTVGKVSIQGKSHSYLIVFLKNIVNMIKTESSFN